ncbi:putative conserved secreted CHAT domain-containing protein [Synechococcus sp. PROS-7-1]|uniref:CHAT domain-containing protein n=1 Tax=Synechococcus sp. PROS-7-1 TaxID=1442556 RepID=UPI00164460DF|nr:CHAT domain-containing protein [Synechococcus sp. PROS-7-1]QNI86494.1 putative conserved secreted CHAT domain-containing protein [Synechococcus sp. PROS-7-1]
MSGLPLKKIFLSFGLPFAVFASAAQPARSQIESDGRLGTSINGGSLDGQSCTSGVCQITGGTDAGSNKFHRFTRFDANRTGSAITGVTIEADSQSNVILGIASSSNGFNLNVPLSLDSGANLFIVSPDGITLSSGASFSNVTNLTLTNRSSLPIGQSQFSVNSSFSETSLLTGTPSLNRQVNTLSNTASPITIGGLTLSIDGSLYVHANSDLTLSNSTLDVPTSLDVGGDLSISDVSLTDTSPLYLYSVGDLSLYDSTLDNHSLVKIDAGGALTISDSMSSVDTGVSISNNTSVVVDSISNFNIYNASIDSNGDVAIDVSGNFYADSNLNVNDSGVSLDQNTTLSLTADGTISLYDSSISDNQSATITSGEDLNAGSINQSGAYAYGVSFNRNASLALTTVGDINIVDSSINDNTMITISAGGDFSFYGSELLRNLPYTSDQYFSDFDVVDELPFFTIDAVAMVDIDDSSIDFNGPFRLISSTSDVNITNSDFLDNLYPYIESVTGDIFIASSLLSRNAYIDAFALGDAYVFDSTVVGNDLVIGAEQGDAAVISSDLEDNTVVVSSEDGDSFVIDSSSVGNVLDVDSVSGDSVIIDSDVVDTDVVVSSTDGDSVVIGSDVIDTDVVVTSTDGDASVFDSSVDNSTLDVETETGDVAISESDVFGSDVFAVSTEGDVVIVSSNVDESVFEAAALVGNIDVLSSDFADNQQLAFTADFDVTISDSAVSGNELVVIDVGNNATIDSSSVGDSDLFVVDVGNEFQSESSTFTDNDQTTINTGSDLSVASVADGDDSSFDVSRSNDTTSNVASDSQVAVASDEQSSSQENSSSQSSSVSASDSDGADDSSASSESESATDSQSDSESDGESDGDSSSERASSSNSQDESSASQSGESESAESATPSVQVSTLDNTVVESNLENSLAANANQVLSALGLDDLSPTPASELTPAKISQSLSAARQVYQSNPSSFSSLSGVSLASATTQGLTAAPSKKLPFNPAYLNIAFTKNSDLGVGNVDNGFVDLTLITSDGTVVGRRSELSLKEFATLLRGFYGKITSQRPLAASNASSETSRLYSLFIEPIDEILDREQVTSVLVSADRGLQAIPFAALARQGNYAVNQTSFSFTPSLALTDLSVPMADPNSDGILIMGSSEFSDLAPLPFVGQEVDNIQQVYDGLVVVEDQFTSQRVLADLKSSTQPLIHLATHADFKGGKPDQSMIHTRDGFISFEAFKSIRRERKSDPIDLFVLSACRSALGDSDSEMGLAGMALQAGAKSAIGSLWYVDDIATSAFFSQFYRYLSRGMTKSSALSMTQRDFASGSIKIAGSDVVAPSGDVLLSNLSAAQKFNYPRGFRHPFFWSGFVLLGTPW